ncbi:tape measure protein [Plantibacter sp. VKM Ac-2885]|uniref:phage tail protein n=1 Tax=Plantibacter sp. VKM Ac-2885 TaxID=2783828 RepID=UPI00188C0AEF|nr:tape measure protein [Plantibacter sp. VKM Ac-2885]MBF4512015.1 tape measure protein [Plantibacter sp. VKM Ac-2885]
MATEIADAYIALYTRMPGVSRDIGRSLGASDVQGAVDAAGQRSGNSFAAGLGKIVKSGAVAVGVAAAAGLGVALAKGFGRLEAIDTAEKKLTGLGQTTENISQIMSNASSAVKGTAFGLGDAATAAASLVAANIKPGEQLQGVLKSVANSASAAGVGIGDMGSIYAKVASLGKAQNDVLQQVADRGIPIYQALADNLGVTTEEVFNMASAGKIGFAEFEAAMTSASGTVAEEMGKTIPGATMNFFAALGRVGEGLLAGVYPMIAPLITAATGALKPIEDLAVKVGEKITGFLGPALQWITDRFNAGFDLTPFIDLMTALSPLGVALKALEPSLKVIGGAFSDIGAVLGGVLMTVIKTLVPLVIQLAEVFVGVLAAVLPQIVPVFEQLATVFGTILAAVEPLIAQLITALLPAFNLIGPLIGMLVPIFSTLISALMPIVEMIFPLLSTLVAALAPVFMQLVGAITPLLTPILALLTPLLDLIGVILPPLIQLLSFLINAGVMGLQIALGFLIPMITSVVSAISGILVPVIQMISDTLGGLITFITGVFTGNWEQAWDGIVQIFAGIWNGMVGIVKGVINGVIDLINGVIAGINNVAQGIKDASGGTIDLTVSELPKLAKGGIIAARPGGMAAILGEGRYDEAVVPLSPQNLEQIRGGGSGGITQNNTFEQRQEDPQILFRQAGRLLEEAMG